MGLVDYSDSESEGETPSVASPAPKPAAPTQPAAAKQPFQKLVDKANPGKILVNLPSATPSADDAAPADDNPAKRRKIGAAAGGGRFGGFSSFLPPPKATATSKPAGGKTAAPRVGVNLKTSGEAAFSRSSPSAAGGDGDGDGDNSAGNGGAGSGLRLPPPKAPAQPSIPEGQKTEEEVKLVGKPLLFKPLSVARKPGKKVSKAATNGPPKAVGGQGAAAPSPSAAAATPAQGDAPQAAAAPPKRKKVSLFSMADDTPPAAEAAPEESAPYEPEFTSYNNDSTSADGFTTPYDSYQQQQYEGYAQPPANRSDPNSLDSIADDLNLSAAARRELFGRGGPSSTGTAKSVINFNLDREYRHNEELRASGALDQQQHNPLRAIKPGKHSLQQLVNQVQSQRDALEENFAKNRATQKSAGSKYGFR